MKLTMHALLLTLLVACSPTSAPADLAAAPCNPGAQIDCLNASNEACIACCRGTQGPPGTPCFYEGVECNYENATQVCVSGKFVCHVTSGVPLACGPVPGDLGSD